jgi:hypothetical protein
LTSFNRFIWTKVNREKVLCLFQWFAADAEGQTLAKNTIFNLFCQNFVKLEKITSGLCKSAP